MNHDRVFQIHRANTGLGDYEGVTEAFKAFPLDWERVLPGMRKVAPNHTRIRVRYAKNPRYTGEWFALDAGVLLHSFGVKGHDGPTTIEQRQEDAMHAAAATAAQRPNAIHELWHVWDSYGLSQKFGLLTRLMALMRHRDTGQPVPSVRPDGSPISEGDRWKEGLWHSPMECFPLHAARVYMPGVGYSNLMDQPWDIDPADYPEFRRIVESI